LTISHDGLHTYERDIDDDAAVIAAAAALIKSPVEREEGSSIQRADALFFVLLPECLNIDKRRKPSQDGRDWRDGIEMR
jgi:hypothetical protein